MAEGETGYPIIDAGMRELGKPATCTIGKNDYIFFFGKKIYLCTGKKEKSGFGSVS